jgi:hypothetical protein
MRFLLAVKATRDSEAGQMPTEELLSRMAGFNEQLQKAGVLLDLTGLKPSSAGARIQFAKGGKTTIVDGPFAETKELIAGFWILELKDKAEAVEWARRAPMLEGDVIEVRPYFELSDFAPGPAVDAHKKIGENLGLK